VSRLISIGNEGQIDKYPGVQTTSCYNLMHHILSHFYMFCAVSSTFAVSMDILTCLL